MVAMAPALSRKHWAAYTSRNLTSTLGIYGCVTGIYVQNGMGMFVELYNVVSRDQGACAYPKTLPIYIQQYPARSPRPGTRRALVSSLGVLTLR